ncbi:MAG: hydrogenase 4 subunit B, partial [Candidatus Micrarchaeota archaeon]|nr:hydrogenase 4 subunit B [Candidatus Micrarchaeota archaeon]
MIATALEIFGQPPLSISILLFLAGALLALLFERNSRICKMMGFGLGALGSLLALAAGVSVLLGAPAAPLALASLGPLGTLSFGLDPLSAFFVSIVALVGLAVSIYSFGYVDEYARKGYSLGRLGFLYNIFLLSMILVPAAQNALLFLVVWEIMAISSFFLVTYEYKEEGVQPAGFIYLLVAHIGAAALALMFLCLASSSGSLDFASFHGAAYAPALASAIVLLALFGFGSKCGIIPLHVWLPLAHPQAPSSISALMSGVMLKVAIYGLVRVLFDFLHLGTAGGELWWGLLILALGMASSVLGVLYSLLERDIKRLLAYSSIENVGIIFIGLGAAAIFSWAHLPALAALALFASLYHALNHALFKSLLFLSAGSVVHSTHERNVDELGGLAKFMPATAILFFIGAAAITAIPPLNGFASELLTFQALLGGIGSSPVVSLALALAVLALALTSALAVGAFVKAFGIPFLGEPRSKSVAHAKEAPKTMLAGMGLLAAACIGAGLFPSLVAQSVSGILQTLGFGAASAAIVPIAGGLPSAWILLLLIAGAVAAWAAARFISAGRHRRVSVTWDCGYTLPTSRMEYSSAGFAMPATRSLKAWLDPLEKPETYGPALFDKLFYAPFSSLYQSVAPRSAIFHTGKLNDYLMYLIV